MPAKLFDTPELYKYRWKIDRIKKQMWDLRHRYIELDIKLNNLYHKVQIENDKKIKRGDITKRAERRSYNSHLVTQ